MRDFSWARHTLGCAARIGDGTEETFEAMSLAYIVLCRAEICGTGST